MIFRSSAESMQNGGRPRAWLLGLIGIIFVLAAFPAIAAEEPVATVNVQTQQLGNQIPADFVGLSVEVSTAGQGLAIPAASLQMGKPAQPAAEWVYSLGHPDAPNTVFFKFMRNLGPGVLRLGGNSQDNTCWDAHAAPHAEWCKASLAAGDMKLYSDAATASGWKLIFGINLKQNSPPWALGEVTDGVAKNIPSGQLLGLELGNEPDLFARDGSRPKDYSAGDGARDFLSYLQAFQKAPRAKSYPLMGPATCCGWRNPADLGTFLDAVGPANLKLVTVHEYPATTCGDRVVTIEQLLAPALMSRFNDAAKGVIAEAHKRNLPIALAETNSVSCGGMKGVSNAFAAAAWSLDWLFSSAEDGFTNVNFHISYRTGGSAYNPVESVGWKDASGHWIYRNTAQPLYYAMALFAQNASGKHLLPAEMKSSANIKAYAVSSCSGCAVSVFVINKDSSAAGVVRVHPSGAKGSGSLLLLQAPGLGSLVSEIRYGGSQFDENAELPSPKSTSVTPSANGDYAFTLPNASAAVLTIKQ